MKILIVHSGNNPDTAIHQVDLWRVSHPLKVLRKHVDWQIDERPTIMLHAEKFKTAKDFTEEELEKTVENLASYDIVSGSYTVALYKELARFPITTLGVAAERDFLNQLPSLPRIYDGAALYFVVGSGAATPANSAFSGNLDFVWN